MSFELPEYSFLPWSRRGVATQVDQVDHLGATPDAGPKDRATLTASLTVESVPVPGAPTIAPVAVSQSVALVGPGDVKGFRPDSVLRVMPVAGGLTATPGELAYVEFYDEDFPWRYTPAKATADHRLRPWIALLVLAEGEYTVTPVPGEVAILTVTDAAPLPSPTETWAWAHVQAHGDLRGGDPGATLDDRVNAAPDLALSRLLSPRRLEPNTGYRAFVVPAMETGRLAGLRMPAAPGTVAAQKPAWGQGQPRVFPVLYDWTFRAGEVADFESLARRPKAFRAEADGFGTRDLDISNPGAGVDVAPGTTVGFEGALAPVDFAGRTPYPASPGAPVSDQLRDLVDLAVDFRGSGADAGEDPIVTPPAYARKHAGLARVADATSAETRWVAELNLDPRNRAAAGLGAEIVRQRDEEYMERAWAQVEEIEAVNQRLREADLAMTASDRVYAKHIAHAGPDRLLGLSAGIQSALRAADTGATTIRGEVDASRVPAAAQAPAFRRITRPARPLIATLTTTSGFGIETGLLSRLNEDPGAAAAVSAAPPAPDPVLGVAPTLVLQAIDAVAQQVPRGRDVFPVLVGEEVEARRLAGTLAGLTVAQLRTAARGRLDAAFPAADTAFADLRTDAVALIDAVTAVTLGVGNNPTTVRIAAAAFTDHYGTNIDGKSYLGTVIAPASGLAPTTIAPAAGLQNAQDFLSAFGGLTDLADARPIPGPAAALSPLTALAAQVSMQLAPQVTILARVASVVGGEEELAAGLAEDHRLTPVMAYPTFDDALFEPLRLLGQDYIIPNIGGLPPESISLMVPNVRFIESMLAGVNTEFARELLWNEYPTDQRGTYFRRFFDAGDAGAVRPPDIPVLPGWRKDLGTNSPQLSGLLVLVVRAELLMKFPDTVVFAQRGRYDGAGRRTLAADGEVRYPVIRGGLDPDISLYGFEMTPAEAAGTATDAGFFFCFMERPGKLRFAAPAPGVPGATSAHVASTLAKNPVWLARHATDMLPVG